MVQCFILIVCFLLILTLVGHCLLHVTLISRAIHGQNVETKFHGRRISIDEVIKSINVNFLFFRSIFFIRSIFAFLLFLRDSTLHSKRDNSDN